MLALTFLQYLELSHNGKYTIGTIFEVSGNKIYYNYYLEGEEYKSYKLLFGNNSKTFSSGQKYRVLYSHIGPIESSHIIFDQPISKNEGINLDTLKIDQNDISFRKMLGF